MSFGMITRERLTFVTQSKKAPSKPVLIFGGMLWFGSLSFQYGKLVLQTTRVVCWILEVVMVHVSMNRFPANCLVSHLQLAIGFHLKVVVL